MGRKKKGEIRLCPQCKQPTLKQATNISGWLDSPLYNCTSEGCGYSGRFYILVDPEMLAKEMEGSGDEDSDEE